MNAQIIKIDKELIDHDYLFIIIRDLICKNENNNKQRNYIIIKKFKNQFIMMYIHEILYKDKEYKKIINKVKE